MRASILPKTRSSSRLVVSLACLAWLTLPADEIVMNGCGAQMLVTQRGLDSDSWQCLAKVSEPGGSLPNFIGLETASTISATAAGLIPCSKSTPSAGLWKKSGASWYVCLPAPAVPTAGPSSLQPDCQTFASEL